MDKPLTTEGYEILTIYLANLAGQSKLSWNEKLDWCYDNYDKLLRLYNEDKKKFHEFIESLSEPFQFFSIFIAAFTAFKANKEEIILNNPILFDASCNGIQHLAALTRDLELATNVNEISNSENPLDDKPKDFYSYACALIQKRLDESSILELRGIKLNRNLIKRQRRDLS